MPIGGAVILLAPDERQFLKLAKIVASDANGRYSIRGVRPGDYKIFAGPPGPLPTGPVPAELPTMLAKPEAEGTKVTVKATATTRADTTLIRD